MRYCTNGGVFDVAKRNGSRLTSVEKENATNAFLTSNPLGFVGKVAKYFLDACIFYRVAKRHVSVERILSTLLRLDRELLAR